MKEDWTENNSSYWNAVANQYNESYNDSWSALENDFIRSKLSFLKNTENPKVIDLGCGTGLGFNLCYSINPKTKYTGVDISIEMLKLIKDNYPSVDISNSKMSDLSTFESKTFDAAISIFTAFSYSDDIGKTISEAARVLSDNGQIVVSVISKYSLRRLLYFKFGKKERYKTRGLESNVFSYSWVFTKDELHSLFLNDFKNIKIQGYNAFGGINLLSKYSKLWFFNKIVSNLFSNLSHELIITATKK